MTEERESQINSDKRPRATIAGGSEEVRKHKDPLTGVGRKEEPVEQWRYRS